MTLREKLKIRRIERSWNKYGRKDTFTWVHRYLRLHSELLEDPVYQEIFYYNRATLIAYMKKEAKRKNTSDEQIGDVLDVLADIFNENAAERVNKYKPLIDILYKFWKDNPNKIKDIRI